jgi:hypothetical protein
MLLLIARGKHIFEQHRGWLRKSLSVPVEHVHWTWPLLSPCLSVGWCEQKNQLGHSASVVVPAAFLPLWRCHLEIASERCTRHLCWCHVLSSSASSVLDAVLRLTSSVLDMFIFHCEQFRGGDVPLSHSSMQWYRSKYALWK